MSYVACALAFGLLWVWKNYTPKKLQKIIAKVPYISLVSYSLLLIGTTTLADTGIGGLIGNWLVGPLLGVIASLIGLIPTVSVSAAMLATIAVVILSLAAIGDLVDGTADGIAKTAAIVLPFLVLVAVGPFASAGAGLFDGVSQAGTQAMLNLIGQ